MTTMEHEAVAEFDTYEAYLDSKIQQEHLYYLGSREVARQLFELGCIGGSEVMDRKKFELRKRELLEQKMTKKSAQVPLAHIGVQNITGPLMIKLAELEDDVRNGTRTCLIFIRGWNNNQQEVSAYIDYGDRLRTEDWQQYFSGKKLLRPKTTDLSFYNWKTRTIHQNESTDFKVKTSGDRGIVVTNRRDQKDISLDPNVDPPGDNTIRIDIEDPVYEHCVLYIHTSRRKI